MSKQNRVLVTASTAVLFLLTTSLGGFFLSAARAQSQAAVVAADAKNAAVVEATASVLKETSELRQLPILRAVPSGTRSREEIQHFLIQNLDEDSSPAELRASELALKKLGLVPQNFQFRPFIIKLLTEQVAGYYDPKKQEFYLADWIDLAGQQPVMAHELTHALQDQHFDLRRFEKWPKGDSDAEVAAHALIEGDASLAMKEYVTRSPLRIIALMRSFGASKSGAGEIERAPRALRETLLFPYEKGMEWVEQLQRRGGWPLVSKAFGSLPQSTEQILHPEKYFALEAPIKVNIPDIASQLGSGWKRIDYDVNGEWSYYLILDEYLKSEAQSRQAAAGWGGDRYSVYEGPKPGDVLIIQFSSWDTPAEATEFFSAYVRRTERRYEGLSPLPAGAAKASGVLKAWHTNEGEVLIEQRGSRVLILEGVSAGKSAEVLARSIWGKAGS